MKRPMPQTVALAESDMSNSPDISATTPELTCELLDEVTKEVFGTMFGLDTRTAPADLVPEPDIPCSFVGIGGSWSGTVWVKAVRPLLVEMVSLVNDIPHEEVDDESTLDTLAELANMIGGSFKAKLGDGCKLSLPQLLLSPSDTPHPEHNHCINYLVDGQLVQVFIESSHQELAKAS